MTLQGPFPERVQHPAAEGVPGALCAAVPPGVSRPRPRHAAQLFQGTGAPSLKLSASLCPGPSPAAAAFALAFMDRVCPPHVSKSQPLQPGQPAQGAGACACPCSNLRAALCQLSCCSLPCASSDVSWPPPGHAAQLAQGAGACVSMLKLCCSFVPARPGRRCVRLSKPTFGPAQLLLPSLCLPLVSAGHSAVTQRSLLKAQVRAHLHAQALAQQLCAS